MHLVGSMTAARHQYTLFYDVTQHAIRSSMAHMSAGRRDGHIECRNLGTHGSCSMLSLLCPFAGIWWAMST